MPQNDGYRSVLAILVSLTNIYAPDKFVVGAACILTPSPDLDDSPHCSNQTPRQIMAHQGEPMAVRLIVTITAATDKGSELGKLYKARCEDIAKEPGCEQFEVFQSVVNPDHLVILERWTD